MDYISYERQHNRSVNIHINMQDYNIAEKRYKGHSIKDKFLRYYEPKVLIHSTTEENWKSIQYCKVLKSWRILHREGTITEKRPIGSMLGDYIDYSNYVMLGSFGFWNELVVASKQKSKLIYNKDEVYMPGARIYLDAKKMASDGMLTRDGLHLKVKDSLSLSPYMIWTATIDEVGSDSTEWTPLSFSEKADSLFNEFYNKDI